MDTGAPRELPIGLKLARVARAATHAFERSLADAGGSAATWQVLLLVRAAQWDTQSKLARALGITNATLTHHLSALERRGLVRRERDPQNRRVQRVELTPAGAEAFDRLRGVVADHDRRLRAALTDDELAQLRELLDKLESGLY